jgi:hypothetical protein
MAFSRFSFFFEPLPERDETMRTFFRWAARLLALVAALLIIGLSIGIFLRPELFDNLPETWLADFRPAPPPALLMHTVFGDVTLDAEPIEEGEIRFVPLNKKLNPDFAKIAKGKFVAQVKDGEHLVEIRALKEDKQFLPAKFNANTELRFVAKEGEHNFKLQSEAK